MAVLGTGTTVTFGTSGFTCEIMNVNLTDQQRVAINSSHMGTTGGHTFIFGTLVDYGNLELEINFDMDTYPPIDQPAETVTVTDSEGNTFVGTAGMTNFSAGIPLEDKQTGTCTWKWSGTPVITP